MTFSEYSLSCSPLQRLSHMPPTLLPAASPTTQPSILSKLRKSLWHLLPRILSLAICVLAYLAFRRWLIGPSALAVGHRVLRKTENPLPFAPTPLSRFLSLAHIHSRYFQLLLFPFTLCVDYSFNCVPLVTTLQDPRNVASALTYLFVFGMPLICAWGYMRAYLADSQVRCA